ncbi:MAG: hypothetical protein IT173_17360 [Acidobacteria bacterium]|nr:hypothetical protein [Acidobacteriota bacterium]
MTRRKTWLIVAGVVLLGFAGLVVYQFSGGKEYSTDMQELRAQFNADKGKIRLLMLLSPT